MILVRMKSPACSQSTPMISNALACTCGSPSFSLETISGQRVLMRGRNEFSCFDIGGTDVRMSESRDVRRDGDAAGRKCCVSSVIFKRRPYVFGAGGGKSASSIDWPAVSSSFSPLFSSAPLPTSSLLFHGLCGAFSQEHPKRGV